MVELFPDGFEEVEHSDGIELAAYTDPAGEEQLWHVFGRTRSNEVQLGWEEEWRRFHQPVRVGALWIGPPWLEPDAGAIPVVIEPGRAFGTGGHATTRLCIELLQTLPSTSLLDVGCGSGVISIAAAKLGFAPVVAVDLEQAAVEATAANATRNGVDVDARQVDALVDALPEHELVVANIALATAEELLPTVPGSLVIVSGYLESDRPRAPGWRQVERKLEGGWAADLYERG